MTITEQEIRALVPPTTLEALDKLTYTQDYSALGGVQHGWAIVLQPAFDSSAGGALLDGRTVGELLDSCWVDDIQKAPDEARTGGWDGQKVAEKLNNLGFFTRTFWPEPEELVLSEHEVNRRRLLDEYDGDLQRELPPEAPATEPSDEPTVLEQARLKLDRALVEFHAAKIDTSRLREVARRASDSYDKAQEDERACSHAAAVASDEYRTLLYESRKK